MKRAYLFVDGENHFLRSVDALGELHDRKDAAEVYQHVNLEIPAHYGFPNSIHGRRYAWNSEISFFWDCYMLVPLHSQGIAVERAIYATSCSGDEGKVHDARVYLRDSGFEPLVVAELKQNARNRAEQRSSGLIDKAKGCDIALATRMVSDAAAGNYEVCCLFTSDADFLPAVEAVRRMGKVVHVYGYKSILPSRSAYLHVPDRFVDLETHFRHWKQNFPGAFAEAFKQGVRSSAS